MSLRENAYPGFSALGGAMPDELSAKCYCIVIRYKNVKITIIEKACVQKILILL